MRFASGLELPKLNSWDGLLRTTVGVLAISLSLFHLWTGAFGILESYMQRTLHLMTLMTITFLMFPTSKHLPRRVSTAIDVTLAAVALFIGLYLIVNHGRIVGREWYSGELEPLDYALGVVMIPLLLEATRRVVGLALPIIALVFLAYSLWGNLLPPPFTIRTPPVHILIDHMFLTPQAIFGVPLGVSATFVFLFILFGAFLEKTGGGQFIIDFSLSLMGRSTGGPAKVAVVASSLFGTISGHSVANVYGTGTFTIPLMKKFGYSKDFAGAVEAAASTGGQILPPVMGAAAFIMAEMMGKPYTEIVVAAIVPALLYYLAVFLSTHFEAVKKGLKGLSKEEAPSLGPVLTRGFHFFIPIFVLVYFLFTGYTPFRAAFAAIVALIIVSMLRRETRLGVRGFLKALEDGGRNAVVIAVTCGTAGIIVGVLDTTGAGIRFVSIVTSLSGGDYFLTLLLVMIACLILGMGIPTAPAYIIAAMIAAPALIKLGAEPIVAHMFVFYSALLSSITPPVALAAYAGAAISGGGVMMTAVHATRLGFVKFIVPYMFAYDAGLLMVGAPQEVLWVVSTATLGTVGLVMAFEGYCFTRLNPMLRLLFVVAGFSMFTPHVLTDVLGLALGAMAVAGNWFQWRQEKRKRAEDRTSPQVGAAT